MSNPDAVGKTRQFDPVRLGQEMQRGIKERLRDSASMSPTDYWYVVHQLEAIVGLIARTAVRQEPTGEQ